MISKRRVRPESPALAHGSHNNALGHVGTLHEVGTLVGLSDRELLERYSRGGGKSASSAFAALMDRHGPPVLRICRGILHDRDAAADAFQATFLVLMRKARGLRVRDSVAPWLYQVAHRTALFARTVEARRRRHEARAATRPDAVTTDPPPRDWVPVLHEELERLPERYRLPLLLCGLEGLTIDEAAGRLGWRPGTVASRLARGRDRLRRRLRRRGVAPAAVPARVPAAPPTDLPPACVRAALHASATFAEHGPGTGGVPARVVALAQGVIHAMTRTKLAKAAVAAVLAVGVATLVAPALTALSPPLPAGESPEAPAGEPPKVKRAYSDATPAVAARRLLDVSVVNDAAGTPLADAQVRVSEYVDLKEHDFATDPRGRLRVEYPMIDTAPVIEVRMEGYVPQRHEVAGEAGGPPRASLAVRLRAGTPIGGTVVDEAGAPIAGATVVVTVKAYSEAERTKLDQGYEITYEVPTTTDAAGRWRCGMISAAASEVSLQLIHPDYVSGGPETMGGPGLRRPAMEELRAGTDRQVMARGVRVEGRVLDRDGQPVPGAEVADSTEGLTFLRYLRRMTTDAEGRFRFQLDPADRVALVVRMKGYAPTELIPRIEPGAGPVEVRLGPARTIRGRVVDHEGNPVPATMVHISRFTKYQGLFLSTWTDAQGRFRWDEAPDDAVPLSFSRRGYMWLQNQPIAPSEREAVIVLKPAVLIVGKIRDAATGAEVMPFTIEAGAVDPEVGPIEWDPTTRMTHTREADFRLLRDGTVPAHRFRITAAGYETFISRAIRGDEGEVSYEVGLVKLSGEGHSGVVRGPDGKPLAGAVVAAGGAAIRDGTIAEAKGAIRATTDAEGRFALPPTEEPFPIVVAVEAGFAEVTREGWAASNQITVQPWGRIEGELRVGDRPAAGREVELILDRLRNLGEPELTLEDQRTTDAQGRFTFERVIPSGDLRLFHDASDGPPPRARSYGVLVAVAPGETSRVVMGGTGRPVVGRAVPPEGQDPNAPSRVQIELKSDRPRIPYPPDLLKARDDSASQWSRAWWSSEEGRAYRRASVSRSIQSLGTDGAFRFDDVPAGSYQLGISWGPERPGLSSPGGAGPARLTHIFTLPEIPGGRSEEPFDLGPLRPTVRPTLKAGDPAPPLAARTLDGAPLDLGDYRGKYVLLDFWATWCGPCIAELPHLKEVHAAYAGRDDFAMLGLSLDDEAEAPRGFVTEREIGWTQGWLGPWQESEIARTYHVEAIPTIMLIGPDGRVVRAGLRGGQIRSAVATALEGPR